MQLPLEPANRERLLIHCIMTGKQPGEFLDDLIERHCCDWKVQVNPHGSAKASDRPDLGEDVSNLCSM